MSTAASVSSTPPVVSPQEKTGPPPVPTIKRFWKHATVKQVDDTWHVMLDSRPLKTPKGKPCILERPYRLGAHLVAGEWEGGKIIRQHSLPLTSIVCRSLDMEAPERKEVTEQLLAFLDTDSVLHFQEYPEHMVRLQEEHFTPLLQWMEATYGVSLVRGGSILGSRQTPETRELIRQVLLGSGKDKGLSALEFSAVERITRLSKSLTLGLATVQGSLSSKAGVEASLVEQTVQLVNWQEIEEGHTMERANLRHHLGGVRSLLVQND
ncbi:hypothetical protein BJ684DRAFT_19095 [Piptocephalis cylindrospora]|uniref:ATP12-domain-containing protein n=1 Tax=Piptocephalis cylindrospora TaxID=1907219 RepID=A0A4P9Y6B3_9FUNG|nr:hypothetical protein BJ684DRAFT_19095 [Piptocephalis cylindrospora]|eukprot:RKP14503.1 hypothetical protein BJ684DRAFT_19095 [Piptocephalis cylindrospora]